MAMFRAEGIGSRPTTFPTQQMQFQMPAFTPPTPVSAPPPMNINIQRDPRLERLAGAHEQYIQQLRSGTSPAIIGAMQSVRDAAEGERAALRQSGQLRGAPAHEGMGALSRDIQRRMQRAGMQTAQMREQMLQGALTGAVGAAQAPLQMGIQQAGLGLGAGQLNLASWQAAQQANLANQQNAFNQQMMMRQMQQQSPLVPTGWGGNMGGYM